MQNQCKRELKQKFMKAYLNFKDEYTVNFADAIPQIFVTSSLYQSRAQNIQYVPIPGYDRISAGL